MKFYTNGEKAKRYKEITFRAFETEEEFETLSSIEHDATDILFEYVKANIEELCGIKKGTGGMVIEKPHFEDIGFRLGRKVTRTVRVEY